MADLIDRDALIAEYDRVHVGTPGGARKLMQDAPAVNRWIPAGADLTKFPTIGTYKQNPELAEAFKKAMEESPHVLVIPEKPRWIPCSERLPEQTGYYLVWTDSEIVDIAEFYTFADFVPKEIANNYWNKASKVLYWMPMPEPPEKE